MAAYDARIILAGQQPDLLEVMERSDAAAQQRIGFDRQNALAQLYQTQGPGIAAGDPNAVNALAQFDPMAAMNVQGTIADRQRGQVVDGREDELWRRQTEEYAAGKTAAERAQAAAQIEDAVKMGLGARTPQEWNALMTQMGAQDLVGQFAMRESIANRYMSVAEILKGQGGGEAYTLSPGATRFGPDNKPLASVPSKTDAGLVVETMPDGTTRVTQGGTVKPPTERQSVIALFGSMMDSTMPVINELEGRFDPANIQDRAASSLGTFGNFMKSQDMQSYEVAASAWAEAVLRIQTGAAATAPEIERVRKTYFAVAGDSSQTVAEKRMLRDEYAKAIVAASGGTLQQPGADAAVSPAADPSSPPSGLSPEAQTVFEKYRTKP